MYLLLKLHEHAHEDAERGSVIDYTDKFRIQTHEVAGNND